MELQGQIALLDRALLSGVSSAFPTPLSDDEKARVASFLVLGHACIEEYLEDLFEEYVDRLLNMATSPLVPGAAVGLFLEIGLSFPEDLLKSQGYNRRSIGSVTKAVKGRYRKHIANPNNGLKEHNVKSLAKGAGIAWSPLEALLSTELADLETLGAKRGESSHISPFSARSAQVTNTVYPDEVRRWVHDAVRAAQRIDAYVRSLIDRQIRSLAVGGVEVDPF